MGSFFLHLHRSKIRCLSHSTVLSIVIVSAIGIKALPNRTTTLSSEFKRGHRKTTKGIINVNRTLRLKTGFHQKAMRSQTENRIKRTVLHKSMQSDWGTALKTGLISLLFLLLRSYDANLRQNFKSICVPSEEKLSIEKCMMNTGKTIQNLRNTVHKKVTIYAVENCDSRESGQGIHNVFLARYWLRSGGEQHVPG